MNPTTLTTPPTASNQTPVQFGAAGSGTGFSSGGALQNTTLNGSTQGTPYNPYTSSGQVAPSGFSSSAQPAVNSNTNQSVTNGFNGLTGPSGGTQPTSSTSGGSSGSSSNLGGIPSASDFMGYAANMITQSTGLAMNQIGTEQQMVLQNAALANQSLGLSYNTSLGALNTQYSQAFQSLQTQHANTVGAAISQMATADPLGTQSSSFASGYVGKINDMYNQQASFLTAAYGQQQVALQNQDMQGAISIQQQIDQSQVQIGQQVTQLLTSQNQAFLQASQTGLGIAEFGYQRQQQSQSLFNTSLNSATLPAAAITASGLISGSSNGNPTIDTGVLSGASQAITGYLQTGQWTAPQGMTPAQSTALQQIMNDPTFQTGLAAGYSPSAILQQMAQGSNRQTELNLQTEAQTRAWSVAGAQYGITPGGGSSQGSGGASSSSGFTPGGLGATITASAGIQTAPPAIVEQVGQFTTAASTQSMDNITSFVNSGDTSTISSTLGPLINSVTGSNVGNVITSADAASTAAGLLGVSPTDFANLSNQSPLTRAKAAYTILSALQGQMTGTMGAYANHYDLKNDAGDLDSASSNIGSEISSLSSYLSQNGVQVSGASGASGTSPSAGGASSMFSALNNSSWSSLFNPSWFGSSGSPSSS